jgi:hypothetical protein
MSSATVGTNESIQVTPGTDLYFRKKATASQFPSNIQTLETPARPTLPAFAINFANETTSSAVSSAFEYANNQNMTGAIAGNGTSVSLIPGSNVFFRQKATASQFASSIQNLLVPSRPQAVLYSIDFIIETTGENVPSQFEYAKDEEMADAVTGAGTPITLLPGDDYYLRLKSTASAFSGQIFHLSVPARPVIVTTVNDTVTGSFNVTLDFHGNVTGFEVTDIQISNASVTLNDALSVTIDPINAGIVTARIKANAVEGGNFTSEELSVYFKIVTASDDEQLSGSLILYPTPVTNVLNIHTGSFVSYPVHLSLLDGYGITLFHVKSSSEHASFDMNSLPSGMYFLQVVDSHGNKIVRKFVKN